MPNARKKSKRLVGFFATPEEKERLLEIADEHEISLAELLRRIATGDLAVSNARQPERERAMK